MPEAAKSPDQRLEKLERFLALHQYFFGILGSLFICETVALAILWGEKGKPDFDHIAVSLTVFQTLFGIAALYGFWALRGLTRDRAGEVATEVAEEVANRASVIAAERIAEKEVRELAPPIILRAVKEAMETFRQEGPISEGSLDRMVASIGGKEEGSGK